MGSWGKVGGLRVTEGMAGKNGWLEGGKWKIIASARVLLDRALDCFSEGLGSVPCCAAGLLEDLGEITL